MKKSASRAYLPLPAEDALSRLGERISLVRRARMWTQSELALKSGIGMSTMGAIESGSPTVQMGFYLGVLFALDALEGFDRVLVLAEDETAIKMLGDDLPKRVKR
jgi:transcriptional regulator with XRE-family HTH domain